MVSTFLFSEKEEKEMWKRRVNTGHPLLASRQGESLHF